MLIDIIDDEPHVREVLAEIIEILGYESRQFSSGDAYLTFVLEAGYQPPSVMISDVRMPGMDGYSLMRRVHALYPAIQIIIVTGYHEVKDKCADVPHEFMRKPFNPEVLEATLEAFNKG